jgi:hypothetical protein
MILLKYSNKYDVICRLADKLHGYSDINDVNCRLADKLHQRIVCFYLFMVHFI